MKPIVPRIEKKNRGAAGIIRLLTSKSQSIAKKKYEPSQHLHFEGSGRPFPEDADAIHV